MFEDEYDEEDDFIIFQYESKQINLYYSHLVKYSRLIRKDYVYSDVKDRLPQELHHFQKQNDINSENIFLFFKLLEEDFIFNSDLLLTCKQYTDLFKISEFFQIKKLTKRLRNYFNVHNADVDFIIQIIIQEIENPKNIEIPELQVNEEMENVLSTKINECLSNDQFSMIPIPQIYRIIGNCDMKKISFDLLYDFIKKDLNKNCVLFHFINLPKLSEEKIKDLYSFYSNANESQKPYFNYLKCNLDYIMKLKETNQDEQSNLRNQIDELKSSLQKTQNYASQVENERNNLNLYHKTFADRIRSIIPDKNDDERINIVDHDTRLSYEVRSIFSNNSDDQILGFICKDIELSSNIRGIFKSGDDFWIKNQIEEDHNQIPVLKGRIKELESEKNNLQNKFSEVESEKNNLEKKFSEVESEKNNLQNKFSEVESEKNNLQNKFNEIEKENSDLINKCNFLQMQNIQSIQRINQIPNSNYLLKTSGHIVKIAINGFGRIGRLFFRACRQRYPFQCQVVAIHDLCNIKTNVHLLNYDTAHRPSAERAYVTAEDVFEVGSGDNKWAVKNICGRLGPSELPWKELGVDIVIESTGLYRKHAVREGDKVVVDGYDGHIFSGAKRVILTVPSADEIECTLALGVNDEDLKPTTRLISHASCTTNCLAPIIKTLNDKFGVLTGFFTSVHSYTDDQHTLDKMHRDLRRARAAAMNILPTSSGAAITLPRVVHGLTKGCMDGISLRVPTITGSLVNISVNLREKVTKEQVNEALKAACETQLKGIMRFTLDPIVSSDVIDDPHSSIVDGLSTMVIQYYDQYNTKHRSFVKVVAWYDNEWMYSCRCADICYRISAYL